MEVLVTKVLKALVNDILQRLDWVLMMGHASVSVPLLHALKEG